MNNNCSDQIIRSCARVKCVKEAEFAIIRNDIKEAKKPPVLTETIISALDVGGVKEGDTFLKGTTLQSVLKAILAPEEPVIEGKLYFATLDEVPQLITSEFTSEDIPSGMINNGVVHYYTTEGLQYECFAFPSDYGELKHIYENDMTAFDLINDFVKIVIVHEGINYYCYYGAEKVMEQNCKYQFLWK